MPASDTPITDEVRMLDSISNGQTETGDMLASGKPKRSRAMAITLILLAMVAIAAIAAVATMAAGMTMSFNGSGSRQAKAVASSRPQQATTGSETADAAGAKKPVGDMDHLLPEGEGRRDPGPLTKALEEGLAPPPSALKHAREAAP